MPRLIWDVKHLVYGDSAIFLKVLIKTKSENAGKVYSTSRCSILGFISLILPIFWFQDMKFLINLASEIFPFQESKNQTSANPMKRHSREWCQQHGGLRVLASLLKITSLTAIIQQRNPCSAHNGTETSKVRYIRANGDRMVAERAGREGQRQKLH